MVLFEILSDPSGIIQLLNLICQLLELISRKLPALKLADKILPGILMLRCSRESICSKWAIEILKKKSRVLESDYQVSTFEVFIRILRGEETEWDKFVDIKEMLEMMGDLIEKMDGKGGFIVFF